MDGTKNSCGACTMCCRLTAVPELGKPFGAWCRFCHLGKGCKIYDTRPPSCQKYFCLWLQGKVDESLRPDKCKVVFEQCPGSERTILCLVDPGRKEAWKDMKLFPVVKGFVESGKAVVVPGHMFLPKGTTKAEVLADMQQALRMNQGKEE